MVAAAAPPAMISIDGHDVFIDVFLPPPQLLIVGASNDARPLARYAAEAGFRATVADRRPALLVPDRFPASARLVDSGAIELAGRVRCDANTFAVVMTHNYADDEQYLRALVATAVPCIGIVGPRQRTEWLIRSVHALAPFNTERVYAP